MVIDGVVNNGVVNNGVVIDGVVSVSGGRGDGVSERIPTEGDVQKSPVKGGGSNVP